MSGLPIGEEFTEGWALWMRDDRAHVWRKTPGGDAASMICAPKVKPVRLVNGQFGLFEPGTFPRCKRCEARRGFRLAAAKEP